MRRDEDTLLNLLSLFSVIHFFGKAVLMFLFLFLVENRERHATIMEIRALSMESLSDQRENIGRLALSVCERERGFGSRLLGR